MTESQLVAKYLRSLRGATRRRVAQMRSVIRATVPDAVDGFSYRMPCVRSHGKIVVWYAAFTHHTSLFPMTARIRRKESKGLAGLETSKGTVRFPLESPLPVSLIKRLVRARLAEMKHA